jgi:hypothetical protein
MLTMEYEAEYYDRRLLTFRRNVLPSRYTATLKIENLYFSEILITSYHTAQHHTTSLRQTLSSHLFEFMVNVLILCSRLVKNPNHHTDTVELRNF